MNLFLALCCLLLFLSFPLVICLRAYWYFFKQTEQHRSNLEKMMVELIRRMPLEETRKGPNDYGIQVLLYNCHFRLHGRAYDQSYRHGTLPFRKWLMKGFQLESYPYSEYGRDGLFLDDGMFSRNTDGYVEFLETLGYDAKELERD